MRLRDDVVLEKVCGVYVLVALRSAWGECPFAYQIAPFAATIWEALRKGADRDGAVAALRQQYDFPEKKLQLFYDVFAKDAVKFHYAVFEENDA